MEARDPVAQEPSPWPSDRLRARSDSPQLRVRLGRASDPAGAVRIRNTIVLKCMAKSVSTFVLSGSGLIGFTSNLLPYRAPRGSMLTRTQIPEPIGNGIRGSLESQAPFDDRGASLEHPQGGPVSLSISVVIPTKNEVRNIGWVISQIDPIVDELIIVDGLSTDGTVEIVKALRPDAVVILHPIPGKGEAVRAGFAAATGDLVVMLDADGSMDPGEIQGFVERLAEGHDVVKGSQFLPGGGTTDMTWLRRLGNEVFVRLSNALMGTRHTDLCYGYMAFRRSRLQALRLRSTGFEIETELVLKSQRAGLAIVEVPSFESARRFGTSNLSTFRDGWRVLRLIGRYRFAGQAAPAEPDAAEPTVG